MHVSVGRRRGKGTTEGVSGGEFRGIVTFSDNFIFNSIPSGDLPIPYINYEINLTDPHRHLPILSDQFSVMSSQPPPIP